MRVMTDINRFIHAQDDFGGYQQAVRELKAGRKTGHWIWYIFPQIQGLGRSSNSKLYAISSLDEAKAYYEAEVPVSERREISNDVSMASIRAYLLMSGLLDKSRSECIIALNNVYRAFKHTPKNRQTIEIVLFNEALDKVIAAHPDWELEGYRLQEVKK